MASVGWHNQRKRVATTYPKKYKKREREQGGNNISTGVRGVGVDCAVTRSQLWQSSGVGKGKVAREGYLWVMLTSPVQPTSQTDEDPNQVNA